MYSATLVEVHFWLALAGTVIYVFAMWNSGIIQGLMWRTYNDERHARLLLRRFPGRDASLLHRARDRRPAVPDRRGGRLLQHLDDHPHGPISAARAVAADRPAAAPAARRRGASRRSDRACSDSHYRLERKAIGFVLAIIGVASIGGLVEIAPLFTIHQTVEDAPDMRVYTPLEAGRPQHLHPRGLLRLPLADDPHAARRGRALRSVLARGRIQIRPSDAVGLQAHRARPRAARRQIFRRMACRASDQSARRGAGIGHAAYAWLGAHRAARPTISARISRRCATVGVPYTDEMIANATSDAYGQASPDTPFAEGVTKRYGEATNVRAFDGKPGELTEMDALVAYLQILGR